MNKYLRQVVLIGLFVVSLGAAGAVFTVTAVAGPLTPSCSTVHCSGSEGCLGSTCTCQFDGGTKFECIKQL